MFSLRTNAAVACVRFFGPTFTLAVIRSTEENAIICNIKILFIKMNPNLTSYQNYSHFSTPPHSTTVKHFRC